MDNPYYLGLWARIINCDFETSCMDSPGIYYFDGSTRYKFDTNTAQFVVSPSIIPYDLQFMYRYDPVTTALPIHYNTKPTTTMYGSGATTQGEAVLVTYDSDSLFPGQAAPYPIFTNNFNAITGCEQTVYNVLEYNKIKYEPVSGFNNSDIFMSKGNEIVYDSVNSTIDDIPENNIGRNIGRVQMSVAGEENYYNVYDESGSSQYIDTVNLKVYKNVFGDACSDPVPYPGSGSGLNEDFSLSVESSGGGDYGFLSGLMGSINPPDIDGVNIFGLYTDASDTVFFITQGMVGSYNELIVTSGGYQVTLIWQSFAYIAFDPAFSQYLRDNEYNAVNVNVGTGSNDFVADINIDISSYGGVTVDPSDSGDMNLRYEGIYQDLVWDTHGNNDGSVRGVMIIKQTSIKKEGDTDYTYGITPQVGFRGTVVRVIEILLDEIGGNYTATEIHAGDTSLKERLEPLYDDGYGGPANTSLEPDQNGRVLHIIKVHTGSNPGGTNYGSVDYEEVNVVEQDMNRRTGGKYAIAAGYISSGINILFAEINSSTSHYFRDQRYSEFDETTEIYTSTKQITLPGVHYKLYDSIDILIDDDLYSDLSFTYNYDYSAKTKIPNYSLFTYNNFHPVKLDPSARVYCFEHFKSTLDYDEEIIFNSGAYTETTNITDITSWEHSVLAVSDGAIIHNEIIYSGVKDNSSTTSPVTATFIAPFGPPSSGVEHYESSGGGAQYAATSGRAQLRIDSVFYDAWSGAGLGVDSSTQVSDIFERIYKELNHFGLTQAELDSENNGDGVPILKQLFTTFPKMELCSANNLTATTIHHSYSINSDQAIRFRENPTYNTTSSYSNRSVLSAVYPIVMSKTGDTAFVYRVYDGIKLPAVVEAGEIPASECTDYLIVNGNKYPFDSAGDLSALGISPNQLSASMQLFVVKNAQDDYGFIDGDMGSLTPQVIDGVNVSGLFIDVSGDVTLATDTMVGANTQLKITAAGVDTIVIWNGVTYSVNDNTFSQHIRNNETFTIPVTIDSIVKEQGPWLVTGF